MAKIEILNTATIIPIQDFLSPLKMEKVIKARQQNTPILPAAVRKIDDLYYTLDGSHRLSLKDLLTGISGAIICEDETDGFSENLFPYADLREIIEVNNRIKMNFHRCVLYAAETKKKGITSYTGLREKHGIRTYSDAIDFARERITRRTA